MSTEMQIDQVLAQMRALSAQAEGQLADPAATGAKEAEQTTDFSQVLRESIEAVDDSQAQAAAVTEAFQKGDPSVNVTELMTTLEKASLSFEAMNAARDRLLSAYREIMSMSV